MVGPIVNDKGIVDVEPYSVVAVGVERVCASCGCLDLSCIDD